MDLEPLKIDRQPARKSGGTARRRSYGTLIRWIVVLAIVAVIAYLFQGRIVGYVDRFRLPEVQTVRAVKKSAAAAASATGASANGYIVPRTRAALSADTPGRIVEMNVVEGSVVKKGDVVARLYADEYAAALRRTEADLKVAEVSLERVRAQIVAAAADLERLRSVESAAAADVSQYEAQWKRAELDYKRAESLLTSNVGSVQARDQARADLDSAQARVTWSKAMLEAGKRGVTQGESSVAVAKAAEAEAIAQIESFKAGRDLAKATLDKTEVRAPFDGIVVLKDAEVGEVVSPNVQGGTSARGSVVTMVDFASLEVQAEVPETSLAAVKVGERARIYLDAYPEKPYPGRVDRVWPTANRTKATVEVRVEFEARDDRLRPEMGVRVVFGGEEGKPLEKEPDAVIFVPTNAVVKIGGQSGVFVVERDTVRFAQVSIGEERAGRVVVQTGLSEGQVVVVDPPARLKDGDRVIVKGGR